MPEELTSATRHARERWFSVCIFSLKKIFGLTKIAYNQSQREAFYDKGKAEKKINAMDEN